MTDEQDTFETVDAYIARGGAIPDKVGYTKLSEGTVADFAAMQVSGGMRDVGIADWLIRELKSQRGDAGVYPVNRYMHGLQTATLAFEAGVRDEQMLMAALFHDIGDLSIANHAEVAAAILKPYVRPEIYWIVKHHEMFQAHYYGHFFGDDRNMRDRFRGHPHFEATVRFCEQWDDPAFDPKRRTMPLSEFEPMARRVFARPLRDVWDHVDDD